MLSRYLEQPSTVHLVQSLHILKYIDQHNNNKLAFDLAYHNVENPDLIQAQMKAMNEMYPYVVKDMPPNSPLTRDNPVEVGFFL